MAQKMILHFIQVSTLKLAIINGVITMEFVLCMWKSTRKTMVLVSSETKRWLRIMGTEKESWILIGMAEIGLMEWSLETKWKERSLKKVMSRGGLGEFLIV